MRAKSLPVLASCNFLKKCCRGLAEGLGLWPPVNSGRSDRESCRSVTEGLNHSTCSRSSSYVSSYSIFASYKQFAFLATTE